MRIAVCAFGTAEALGDVADEVRCEGWVPYGPLFARASVVIHHGGIGSTAEGLRAGVPNLVLSFGDASCRHIALSFVYTISQSCPLSLP